jgi:hypothetical protein
MLEISRPSNIDAVKRLQPLAYALHDYLCENAVGEHNGILARDLVANIIGIDSTRQLRELRNECNSSKSELQRKILTSNKGYYIATKEDTIAQYKKARDRKYKMAISLLMEVSQYDKSMKLDGQLRLQLTRDMKDIVEIAGEND